MIKQKSYIEQFRPSLQFHIINVLVNITNLHVMKKYYTYFTLSSMGSSMHHTEERLHCGQILKSRKDTSSFLQVWPIFASHIHCKKCCLGWHELLLKIQRVGKYLPPVHIKSFQKETVATHCNLHPLFIQFGSPPRCLPRCCPLGVPTCAFSLCL